MKKNYYQYIRGLCILSVLLIHTLFVTDNVYLDSFNIILRRVINFTVPIFIFLAGYFVKYDNWKEFYKKKVKRILVPLCLWKIIYGIVTIKFKKISISLIIKSICLDGFHLYYLIVLFTLVLLTPIIIKYINNSKNKVITYFPLFITFIYNFFITIYCINYNKILPCYNYYVFGWFSYYYLGLLFKYKKIENSNSKLLLYYILCLAISIAEGLVLYIIFNSYDLAASQITMSNFLYCMILCFVIKSMDSKTVKNSIIVEFDNYSYGIYLSHIVVLMIIRKIMNIYHINYFLNITITYVLLVFIMYLISYVYYNKIKKVKH